MKEEERKENQQTKEEQLGEISHRQMEQELAHQDDDQVYGEFKRVGKHPVALYILFFTEMWERFSYYGMRALLVLYVTDQVTGLGWSAQQAGSLYGTYTGLVYVTPLIGGWLADRYLGFRMSVIIGGILMMLGHLALAFEPVPFFYTGLGLLIIGNGFFKPNISSMVGQLYPPKSALKDSAYTIFYMGINLGAFFGALICGYLGEKVGWHWGFGAAGIGMGLGLIQYYLGRGYLGSIGLRPPKPSSIEEKFKEEERKKPMTTQEYKQVAAIVIFAIFSIVFWFAFEQAGSSMNIFARDYTNRMIFGWEMPATWFQSFNAAFIVMLAPFFSWLWVTLGKAKANPNTPIKFALGLLLLAFGFFVLSIGSNAIPSGADLASVSMIWLTLAYLFHTMGELCLSPVGLSAVNKLSPPKLLAMMFGVWFFASAIGNKIAGNVAGQIEQIAEESSMADFFMLFVYIAGGAGIVMLLLSPLINRLMGDVK